MKTTHKHYITPRLVREKIVQESFKGNKPIKEIALANGINPKKLYVWRYQHRVSQQLNAVPVAQPLPEIDDQPIEIEISGVILRLANNLSPVRIAEIIKAIQTSQRSAA